MSERGAEEGYRPMPFCGHYQVGAGGDNKEKSLSLPQGIDRIKNPKIVH